MLKVIEKAVRNIVFFFFLLSACHQEPAAVKAGCYRFSDGRPLFIIKGTQATFKIRGAISKFGIGSWKDEENGDFITRPGFYLHDGRFSEPNGPEDMPATEDQPPKDSFLNYHVTNGVPTIQIPVEAYGFKAVTLGPAC